MVVDDDTGRILYRTGYIGGELVDLEEGIIAPGFLELQTNGVNGFHFTHFKEKQAYDAKVEETAKYYMTKGVTGFWATVPTVSKDEFHNILPSLTPRSINNGASLLGAHCEGPYLHPNKKGAHDASLFQDPSKTTPVETYGQSNMSSIKYVTLAPELPNSNALIKDLVRQDIRVSLGHSTATYAQGLEALSSGATSLTHTLNCMSPITAREPGLAGLINVGATKKVPEPYYTIIPDGHHVHPNNVAMLYRANPDKCILISDSIELAGLPDGTYPGHAQIPHNQVKRGNLATIEGTDTLIGSCMSLQDGIQNLMKWTGCDVAQAVKCVTENVADFMGEKDRGKLEEGRRADFVVLSEEGEVLSTWIGGVKMWEKKE